MSVDGCATMHTASSSFFSLLLCLSQPHTHMHTTSSHRPTTSTPTPPTHVYVSPDPQVEGSFKFVTHINTAEAGEIEDFLETAVLDNCEGLMIKSLDTPNAIYVPDKRSLYSPISVNLCASEKYVHSLTSIYTLLKVPALSYFCVSGDE